MSTLIDGALSIISGVAAAWALSARVTTSPWWLDVLVGAAAGLGVGLKRVSDAAVAGNLRQVAEVGNSAAIDALKVVQSDMKRFNSYRSSELDNLAVHLGHVAMSTDPERDAAVLRHSGAAAGHRLNGHHGIRSALFEIKDGATAVEAHAPRGYAGRPRPLVLDTASPEGKLAEHVLSGSPLLASKDETGWIFARDDEVVSLIAAPVRCENNGNVHKDGLLLLESTGRPFDEHDLDEARIVTRLIAAGVAFSRGTPQVQGA